MRKKINQYSLRHGVTNRIICLTVLFQRLWVLLRQVVSLHLPMGSVGAVAIVVGAVGISRGEES